MEGLRGGSAWRPARAAAAVRGVRGLEESSVAPYLNGLGDDVRTERHLDAAGRRTANAHVKVHDGVRHCEEKLYGVLMGARETGDGGGSPNRSPAETSTHDMNDSYS